MIQRIKEILKYKELLQNLTVKELKLKYKNSVLGFFWSFLNPLMMMLVYTFAFKYVLRVTTENFAVVLLAGLLPWTFFQNSINSATTSIVSNGNLVKKVYFPREIIPLSMIFSNFINFLITFIVLFLAIMVFKIKIGAAIILLPIVLILLLGITIGLSLILSSLNVIYRDVSHFVEIIFMAWFYLTPIVYSLDLIPAQFRGIILLNPLALVVESVRSTVLYNTVPSIHFFAGMTAYAVILMFIGSKVFRSIEKSFAETI
ncbi:ABC transporter permease [Clostridium polynesiense]|uniref:ABC transporter permease n=1 Tax=Clostridium polynesiense TaxID=1325933 RepID=UPI00058DE079|nr:ABC transporter permease [Clostridium polynesiense]